MLSSANIDCQRRFSTELMEVSIGKVGSELDFMHMGISHADSLAGYSGKTVVMAFTVLPHNSGTSKNFMNVTLTTVTIIVIKQK